MDRSPVGKCGKMLMKSQVFILSTATGEKHTKQTKKEAEGVQF